MLYRYMMPRKSFEDVSEDEQKMCGWCSVSHIIIARILIKWWVYISVSRLQQCIRIFCCCRKQRVTLSIEEIWEYSTMLKLIFWYYSIFHPLFTFTAFRTLYSAMPFPIDSCRTTRSRCPSIDEVLRSWWWARLSAKIKDNRYYFFECGQSIAGLSGLRMYVSSPCTMKKRNAETNSCSWHHNQHHSR